MKPILLLILLITISSQLRVGNGLKLGRASPVPEDVNIDVGVNVNTKGLQKATPAANVVTGMSSSSQQDPVRPSDAKTNDLKKRIVCFVVCPPCLVCFDPSTTAELASGQEIAVEKLHAGDEIVSCKSLDNCGSRYVDHVIAATVIEEGGPFPARNFVFENQRQINVTSAHIMYVYKEENGKMIPVTKAAKDVKVQDLMKSIDGSYSRVVQVIDFNLAKKVSIKTAGGSFFANGVLTSGMCESYQEDDLNGSAKTFLKSYADAHEGVNNCLLAQKDLSMSPNMFAPACLSQLS